MTATLTAIVGILIGAIIQYRFGLLQAQKGKFDEYKAKAYTDFLGALSKIAISQKAGDSKSELEGRILLTDAKARICVYGHKKVITELAHFWDLGPKLEEAPNKMALLKAIRSMREVVDLREDIPSEDEIATLLYK